MNRKLTFAQCKEGCHEMWIGIANGTYKEKYNYLFPPIDRDWDDFAYCFACYWADNDCSLCPINWPKIYDYEDSCPCINSLFDDWITYRKPEVARQIANLEWEEK